MEWYGKHKLIVWYFTSLWLGETYPEWAAWNKELAANGLHGNPPPLEGE